MTKRIGLRGAMALAIFLSVYNSPSAFAERYFTMPADAPATSVGIVLDRPPTSSESGGTQLENTNFSATGATARAAGITSLLFIGGAIGGAIAGGISSAVVTNENHQRASHLGVLRQVDVLAALRNVLAAPAQPIDPGAPHYELVPVVRANFSDPTHFKVDCLVNASFAMSDGHTWKGVFIATAPGEYDTAAPPTLDAPVAQVAPCMREAYRAFTVVADAQGTLGQPTRMAIAGAHPTMVRTLQLDNGQRTLINSWGNYVASYTAEQLIAPVAPTQTAQSAQTAAGITATPGQSVYTVAGARVGQVNRIADNGAPQVIYQGHVVTIPLATLSTSDGKLITTMTRAQLEGQ